MRTFPPIIAVMASPSLAVSIQELFLPSGPEGLLARIVSTLILLLALVAMGVLVPFSLRLRRERRILTAARGNPDEWRDRVRKAREDTRSSQAPRAGGMLERRASEVVLAADAVADAGETLSASDEVRLDSAPPLVFARYVAGALVLLGLAGTLIGLSSGVIGLSGFFTTFDQARTSLPDESGLITAILRTISGLRTAFSTTLAGVVGTLALRLVLVWTEGRMLTYLAELDAFAATVLIPSARPNAAASADQTARTMAALERQMAGVCATLQTSARRLDSVVGSSEPGESLADQAKHLQAALREVQSVVEQESRLAKELRDQIVRGTSDAAVSLRQAVEAAAGSLQDGVKAQTTALGHVAQLQKDGKETAERLAKLLVQIGPTEEKIELLVRRLAEVTVNLSETVTAESNVLKQFEAASQGLHGAAEQVREAGAQLGRASAASEDFRNVLDASLSRVGQALNHIALHTGPQSVHLRDEAGT